MKVPFSLDGQHGVLKHLEHLIETKGFALICVAEGAGQVRSHWIQ
jgi:6-phosphofructokinase 1